MKLRQNCKEVCKTSELLLCKENMACLQEVFTALKDVSFGILITFERFLFSYLSFNAMFIFVNTEYCHVFAVNVTNNNGFWI
jgi:hypothetical protein